MWAWPWSKGREPFRRPAMSSWTRPNSRRWLKCCISRDARFRVQACTFICPYGRLQSAMLDENSMVVAYDHKRGEKRAPLHRGQSQVERATAGLGDCVACRQCVAVCPTGIDIRNGTQMECVNCTACIDACDTIMD